MSSIVSLDQFFCYIARDFDGFLYRAALRYQPLYIIRSCQIRTFREFLDMQLDDMFYDDGPD